MLKRHSKDFQGASSAAAAKAMKTELDHLKEQYKGDDKQVYKQKHARFSWDLTALGQKFCAEMDNFYILFTRYLDEKAKGTKLYVCSYR